MKSSAVDKYTGTICIVMGLVIFLWIALPFLMNLAIALFGLGLCLYGINLRKGGSIGSTIKAWFYRSRLY